MEHKIEIHPLNAKGKYYVDQYICLDHECCEYEAPNNFKMDETDCSAYVYKQPETVEEEARCKAAMMCCPVEAIHDDGEELK